MATRIWCGGGARTLLRQSRSPGVTLRHGFRFTAPIAQSFSQIIPVQNNERIGSYTPLRKHLREIRLLRLFPGEPCDDISCELEVVSLDSKPNFEAVSYVWGKDPVARPIKLNCKKLLVTPNIEVVLRRLRNRKQSRSLWIDAICIDQSNVEERSLQVALMRDIFLYCKGVLVMLGECQVAQSNSVVVWHNNDRDQLEIQNALHEYELHGQVPFALAHTVAPEYFYGAFWFIRLLADNTHLSKIPFLHSQSYRENVLKALQHIMDSPWWNRIWVIQELVLAPRATIFLGNLQAPWEMFAHAAKNYEHHQMHCCPSIIGILPRKEVDVLSQFSRTVLDFNEMRHRWGEGPKTNLLQLLWQFRSRKSTNAADKVYALLGLADNWGRRRPILPDYKLSLHQVYREAVREVIDSMNSLSILMGNLDKHDYLPSWVPDWRISTDPLELQRLQRHDVYNACRGADPSYRLLGDEVLELTGWRIDTISAVSDAMMEPDDIQSISIFQKWYDLAELNTRPQRPYINGGTWADAYWRTLCGDTVFNGETGGACAVSENCYKRAPLSYGDLYGFWSNSSETKHSQIQSGYNTSLENWTARINYAIRSATAKRRFFITKGGRMGLGPPSINVEDKVYIFRGGKTPFVVRKRDFDPGESFYNILIGDCYVHGVMDGEALDDGQIGSEIIQLR